MVLWLLLELKEPNGAHHSLSVRETKFSKNTMHHFLNLGLMMPNGHKRDVFEHSGFGNTTEHDVN